MTTLECSTLCISLPRLLAKARQIQPYVLGMAQAANQQCQAATVYTAMVLSHNTCHELLSLVKIFSQHALAAKEHQSRHSHPKVVAIFPARTCRDVLKNMRTKDFCPSYLVRNSCLVLLTPPLAALRNLLLFSISEEFTTFQHIRPGVGWGVGWDVNVHLHLHTTWMLRCCYVGHGLGWGGMLTFIALAHHVDATLLLRGAWVGVGWDVNVDLHLHTTWMLRCCYVGHGLGWGGMLTLFALAHHVDATLLLRGAWVGVVWDVNVHLHLHTTWMLRCCYVGHGLGWGGMLTCIRQRLLQASCQNVQRR